MHIKWTSKIPDTEVLRRARIPSMETLLAQDRLRWAGHVCRMGTNRIPKQLLYGQLSTRKRKIGKPKLRFVDNLRNSLKDANMDLLKWEDITQNRTNWRKSVWKGTMEFNERQLKNRERKRAKRKGLLGAHGTSDATPWTCSDCGRTCGGRLGLVQHQRTHHDAPAKRRRII